MKIKPGITTILLSRPVPDDCSRESKSPQLVLSQKKLSASSSKRSKSKRPQPTVTINMDTESENEGSHAKKKKRKKSYRNQGFLLVSEAMVHVEQIRDVTCIQAENQEKQQFDAEMQQKDQYHQLQMGKQKEFLLRLRLQVQQQEQNGLSDTQGLKRAYDDQIWLE